jgi:hypothetical protein
MIRYVLLKKFCEITGDTPGAVRDRLHRGVWHYSREVIKDETGRLHVDVEEYNRWVKGDRPAAEASSPSVTASASGSPSPESDTPSPSRTRRTKPTLRELLS